MILIGFQDWVSAELPEIDFVFNKTCWLIKHGHVFSNRYYYEYFFNTEMSL